MSVQQRLSAPPRPVRGLMPRSLERRLSDESGIALVMALAVMLVLTVLVTSAIAFTSSNSRDASRGTGLRGIERRLSAFDGTLTVDSPPGGPTKVVMVLPCAWSSAKISPSSSFA